MESRSDPVGEGGGGGLDELYLTSEHDSFHCHWRRGWRRDWQYHLIDPTVVAMCGWSKKSWKISKSKTQNMEATVSTLVTVFGFDVSLAQRAVDAIKEKDDVQLAWNWILDHGGEDHGGPVIPTQMFIFLSLNHLS
jgi:hypothetical protein